MLDPQIRIAALEAELAARDAIVAAKDGEIAVRDARIQELEQVVAALTQQVAALLRQVEQLTERVNRNSRNSNLPPSSDPPGRPGASSNKGPSGGKRKRGGQPGHRGRHRELVPADLDLLVPQGLGIGHFRQRRPTAFTLRREEIDERIHLVSGDKLAMTSPMSRLSTAFSLSSARALVR